MKTNINGCDGCSCGIATRRPDCIYASLEYSCPCINCLVKPMCCRACDDLSAHYHKIVRAESKGG